MDRQMWLLLGYSPQYGAPIDTVGVLGVDTTDCDELVSYIKWLPDGHECSQTWRDRLESTATEDLPDRLELWQHDAANLASAVELVPDHPDLATAVEIQFHRLLAA